MELTALYTSGGHMVVHRSRCGHELPPDGGGYPEVLEKLYFSASNRQEAMERTWPRSLATPAGMKTHNERWAGRTQFRSCAEALSGSMPGPDTAPHCRHHTQFRSDCAACARTREFG
jgi:hypothetical protein